MWETKREEEAVVWIEWGNPQSMESRRASLDTRSVQLLRLNSLVFIGNILDIKEIDLFL